jgi:glycogen debranching enzyme
VPVRVQLEAPRLALAEGSHLLVSSPAGDIDPEEEHGFFVQDTRLLSRYRLRLGRRRWLPVSTAATTHYSAQLFYVNPGVETPQGPIRRHTLSLTVARTLRGGVHEDLDITNYGSRPAVFPLIVTFECDFADHFEVRGRQLPRRRQVHTAVENGAGGDGSPSEVRWSYQREDFRRGLIVRVAKAGSPPRFDAANRLTFEITLPPREGWHTCLHFIPVIGTEEIAAPEACHHRLLDELETRRQRWYGAVAGCQTTHDEVRLAYRQAVEDLAVLRLTAADSDVEHVVVAAGIPWFATLFGRDSLIITLQTLPFTRQFAPAVLRELGALQATTVDDWRDAQPGKILHEVRHGELAHFHEIPHTPYYGTADATLLYPITLHEAYRWLGDRALVEELLPVAERALSWMDRYGDLDGDGLQEYRRRSSRGIRHQGWKDSGDAVVHADGSNVDAPVALVELQGYAFDARRRMADLYDALDRTADAARLRADAETLRQRVLSRFWWPEEGTFCFALDGSKHQVRSVVSNAGHLLWSGLVPADLAPQVAGRLLAPDMFSGWGIRTLSARHPSFNPFSYQLGSIWPHDNSLIALGFSRYGLMEETQRVAQAIFAASACFQSSQLPELFAGHQREQRSFPAQYPQANIPQGWAAGAVFLLLRALLGLRADAPRRRLLLDPHLPPWLPRLTLTRLAVGDALLDLDVFREGERTRYDVILRSGALEVVTAPWSAAEA